MSIQTELTRISTAKTNIKNVVNNNTANTISNQKLDAFPPLINGTIAAQKGYIPWIKDEGKYLTLKNSKSGELDRFEMYGNTEQNQYSGKNLFNIDAVTGVANGSINANKIIVTNAGTSTNYNVAPGFSTKTLYSGKTYYLSADIRRVSGEGTFGKMNDYVADWTAVTVPTLSTSYQRYTYKKTFSSDTNYYRILIQFRNTNNGIFEIKNIQISEVDNVYEPYVGGTPSPNPDYPQDIRVVENEQVVNVTGKNLFDKDSQNFKQYYILNDNGEETQSNASQYSLNFTKVKPNTTYTIQGKLCSSLNVTRIYEYDENKNWIKRSGGIGISSLPYTFTTNNNTYYLRFQTEIAVYDGNTVQLEEGSTATTYEPYQSQDYEIDLHGKNLFYGKWSNGSIGNNGQNISDSKSIRTTGISVKSGVQYTFSSSTTTSINEFWINYYNGDTFVSREYLSSGNTQTFIVPSGVNIARFRLTATTDIDTNIINNVQLEQNSQATEYEPYYNYELCKIDTYKDEIKKSTGKNLFDNDTSINNYFATIKNGEKINTSVNISDYVSAKFTTNKIKILSYNNNGYRWLSKIINLKKNTDYTISASELHSIKVVGFNSLEDGTDGTRLVFINNQSLTPPKTFNSGEYNYYVVAMYPQEAGNVYTNIQIEEDSIATEYEPYGTDWYIKKEIGKVVLDGSQSINTANTQPSDTNYKNYTYSFDDRLISSDAVCNYFSYDGVANTSKLTEASSGKFYSSFSSMQIIFKTKFASSTDFKTWLSTHNTEVYYVLATPIYETITNETLINQLEAIETFEGINNISIENENNVLPDLLMITKNKDSYNNWKTKEGLN